MSVSQLLNNLYNKKPGYFAGARPEMLPFVPADAKKILDVGCGEGNFGELLKEGMNCEVWGSDISENSIESAKKKLDHAFAGDIFDHLQLMPNNYFDAIFFNDVLEHLIDPYTLLERISCKLSNNGVIIASIPNILHFRTLKKLLVDKDWKYENCGILDKTHLRFFTKKSMRRMFEEQGYEIINIEGINKTKSIRAYLMNIFSLGILNNQIHYLQYVVVAKRSKQ